MIEDDYLLKIKTDLYQTRTKYRSLVLEAEKQGCLVSNLPNAGERLFAIKNELSALLRNIAWLLDTQEKLNLQSEIAILLNAVYSAILSL